MLDIRNITVITQLVCLSVLLPLLNLVYSHEDNTSKIKLSSTKIELKKVYLLKAVKFAKLGQAAGQQGQWHQARELWQQAVEYVDIADVPDRNRAVFYYEFGHAAGISCNFELADEFIEKSYLLDKSIDGPYVLSLVELFRLYYDQGQYRMASVYIDATLAQLQAHNAARNTPELFYELLKQYAKTLRIIGKDYQAQQVRLLADNIQLKYGFSNTHIERILYGSHCISTDTAISKNITQAAFINTRINNIRDILNSMSKYQKKSK